GMYRKRTLYTYTIRMFSNRKCFTNPTVLAFDNNSFENLNSFTTSFNNFCVNSYCITWAKIRKIGRASCREGVKRWGGDVIFSSRRRHTRSKRDWSSDVCSSDLECTGNVRSTPTP